MKKLMVFLSLLLSMNAFAATLDPSGASLIKEAGIPLFAEASFVNGSKEVGFRFATKVPPETVQAWYRQQLASWSLYDEYGGWILYPGTAGIGMEALMSKNQVSVQHNKNLPQWFGVDSDVTTEIVIMIME